MSGYAGIEIQQARRAAAIFEAVEATAQVQRRHQFFLWSQGSFHTLLPHTMAVCGYYDRQRKAVRLEAFNSVVVTSQVLSAMTDGRSALMQHLINSWIFNRGHPLAVDVQAMSTRGLVEPARHLQDNNFNGLLVHGVSRPQRLNEIETLFIFASGAYATSAAQARDFELMLPHLHCTYLRVQAIEQEVGSASSNPLGRDVGFSGASISARECQVLQCAREGLTNHAIGVQLGISSLTVKNHIQKILHKLGASDRAQAVGRAMSMNLLSGDM